MTPLVSTLQKRWQQSFFVLLAWAMLTALIALSQTAFASQEQEKAEVSPWSLIKEQGTRDQGPGANDQTAFTYQGQLKDASGPVSGAYDLQFTLYSAQTGGEQLGSIEIEYLALSNGLFSVRLDFGRAVLEAKESWLEIGVRSGGSSEPYMVLFPRQKLTPTPYAIFAQHEQWSLIGVPVGFAGDKGKVTDTIRLDEKKVSAADVDASPVKPAEKPITSTTPDDGTVTLAANPAACTPAMSGAMAITCDSRDPDPAFSATNTNSMGTGIVGKGGVTGAYFQATGSSGTRVGAYGVGGSAGVWGHSDTDTGVVGRSNSATFGAAGVSGRSDKANTFGTRGYSVNGTGVWGHSEKSLGVFGTTTGQDSAGIVGRYDGPASGAGWGVQGHSEQGFAGVFGSGRNNGVFGLVNGTGSGVYGNNEGGGVGVLGTSTGGDGISGRSFAPNKSGVFGYSNSGSNGVSGVSDAGGVGVLGVSRQNDGVSGRSFAAGKSGVFGFSDNPNGFGGVFQNSGNGIALKVVGRTITNVLQITGGNFDFSEEFAVTAAPASDSTAVLEHVQPGMVVRIDEEHPGQLIVSQHAYDHRVAGIISGAGGIKPGLLMSQSSSPAEGSHPVALTGRVYCLVDASYGSVKPGDLLTTSDTPGHAMKVTDRARAQGAIIGKAMTSLKEGKGLVLVLVTLQ